ncbi:MAG: ECF transporter S component [Firmicutes bacterium]|nr:ECF transporter S component [Bacillota bacterium]
MKKEVISQEEAPSEVAEKNATANTAIASEKPKFFTAGNMAVMGILTAISFVLYAFVKFPLPFLFPQFLDMQISDLPALLGGFALGPIAGCIIIVIKCCLKMPMSSTACIGELADIIIGIANVLPASLIYKFHKNRKGALAGLGVGMLCATVASLIANWLILIPTYVDKFGMGAVLGMMQALYPEITAETLYNYYLPLAVLPFNALRCFICALITYFTYKPLSKALHWEIKIKKKKAASAQEQPAVEGEAAQSEQNTNDSDQNNE